MFKKNTNEKDVVFSIIIFDGCTHALQWIKITLADEV